MHLVNSPEARKENCTKSFEGKLKLNKQKKDHFQLWLCPIYSTEQTLIPTVTKYFVRTRLGKRAPGNFGPPTPL